MDEPICILVLGLGPIASATARLLLLAGHSVALQRRAPPKVLRRRMSFADAWRKGAAALDGVEARLVRSDRAFLAGLRQKDFIPLVDGRRDAEMAMGRGCRRDKRNRRRPRRSGHFSARLRICLGAGRDAGDDCDLVIATDGPDPGALIRKGRAPAPRRTPGDVALSEKSLVAAPFSGTFQPVREIGDRVEKDDVLGLLGPTPVRSRQAGRVLGLANEEVFAEGEPVAEVTIRRDAPVSGVARSDQALARAVHLAIEMEWSGWARAPQF